MTDLVVLGGGLAGAAAALGLAQAGRACLLLEREAVPGHKVCGEFLSHEAQAYLSRAGVDVEALGGAPIDRVRVRAGGLSAERRLPFLGVGLSRGRLDGVLLERARAAGVAVQTGCVVREVGPGSASTSLGEVRGRMLLATGKSGLKGAPREGARDLSEVVGFKTHLRLAPEAARRLAGAVEVSFFEGGYAGLQPIEGGLANLCLLVTPRRLKALGGGWPNLLAFLRRDPALADRLEGAEEVLERPLAVSRVPYGFVVGGGPRADPAGVYRLGDQAAVIPSLTGDGMSIALHSARLAAGALLEDASADAYHRRLRRDVCRPVRVALALQRRAQSWPGRRASVALLAAAPGLLSLFAAATRVPPGALRRALAR